MPQELLQPQYMILLIGLPVSAVAIAGSIIWKMARLRKRTRETEATRREVAAAVAEGSMTPDEAEKVLSASSGAMRRCGRYCSSR